MHLALHVHVQKGLYGNAVETEHAVARDRKLEEH